MKTKAKIPFVRLRVQMCLRYFCGRLIEKIAEAEKKKKKRRYLIP